MPLGRPRADLGQETNVITAGPVLDDLTAGHAPEMDEGPNNWPPSRTDASQQRHRRGDVRAVNGHVVGDKIALPYEVDVLD